MVIVFCYRNLRRKGVVWSIKNKRSNLVVGYGGDQGKAAIKLRDAVLKVSEAGRKRVLRDKRKNVHAGVQGTLTLRQPKDLEWIRVTYDPYKYESFVDMDGNAIYEAKYAKLQSDGVFIAN